MATTKPNIAELVEQMPETDKDILARKQATEQAAGQQNAETKEQKKPRYGEASKFTGPDPDAAAKIFEAILAGGRESLVELLGMIRDPSDSDFKNYKAGYVLHGLAIYVGHWLGFSGSINWPGQEEQRRWISETIAAQLDSSAHSTAVKAFLIRELQVAGDKEVVPALAKQLQNVELCEPATQALLAIREGASQPLQKALSAAKGKNRVTITQALGVLRETAAAEDLKEGLVHDNADIRIASAWALANIGASSASEPVLKLADTSENWERIQATKACLLMAEKIAASGNKAGARQIYTHLRDTRKEQSEAYIRAAAEKALAAL